MDNSNIKNKSKLYQYNFSSKTFYRIACFLTGHNYDLLMESSEASKKNVKKYFSALIIIGLTWVFIGFNFVQRYFKAEFFESLIGGFIFFILILQIERQIILSTKKNKIPGMFRALLGFLMAIIGSVIIDQIIFKDDIEIKKIESVQEKVNRSLPLKTKELNKQITDIQNKIIEEENIIEKLNRDIRNKPNIKDYITRNTFGKDTIKITETIITANPNIQIKDSHVEQLKNLRTELFRMNNSVLTIRKDLENEFNSKVGFIDELVTLFEVLFNHWIAISIWALFFLFFLSIEMFVLVIKFSDDETDYDRAVKYHLDNRIFALNELSKLHNITQ